MSNEKLSHHSAHLDEVSGEAASADHLHDGRAVDDGRVVHLLHDLEATPQLLERLMVEDEFAVHVADGPLNVHHPPKISHNNVKTYKLIVLPLICIHYASIKNFNSI